MRPIDFSKFEAEKGKCDPGYTYFLKHKDTGYKYYGYHTGNVDMFWKEGGYFSSSQLVHYFIKRDGVNSFDAKVHKRFDAWPRAQMLESKFLKRVKANKKLDWLNTTANSNKFGFMNRDIWMNPTVPCPGCGRYMVNFFRKFCTAKCSYKNKHFI